MSLPISDEGIVIHQTRFGEADKFVKILSRRHGFIDTIAKGVRRSTSKKSSHLDNLNLVKFQTSRGKDPQYLSQVESINLYRNIKADLRKIRTCFYLSETGSTQLEIFSDTLKKARLNLAIDQINERWGDFVLTPPAMAGFW